MVPMPRLPRMSWQEYFLGIAESVSARGDCTRSRVGAVIVRSDNIVVSTGYNGVAPGRLGCLDGACPRGRQTYDQIPGYGTYENCIATHAERNAVSFALAAGRESDLVGSSCYITRKPCKECDGYLWDVGVSMVYWPGGQARAGNTWI